LGREDVQLALLLMLETVIRTLLLALGIHSSVERFIKVGADYLRKRIKNYHALKPGGKNRKKKK